MMDKIDTDHRSPKKKTPCRLVSFDEVAVVVVFFVSHKPAFISMENTK